MHVAVGKWEVCEVVKEGIYIYRQRKAREEVWEYISHNMKAGCSSYSTTQKAAAYICRQADRKACMHSMQEK